MIMVMLLSATLMYGQVQKAEKKESKEMKKAQKTNMVPLKKLEGKGVSQLSEDNFKIDFPGIMPTKWERSEYFNEAIYTKDGKNYRAYYDIEGKLVGTTTRVKFTDIPESAQKEIKAQYKDYTIGPVIFYDDNEMNSSDMFLYGQQFEDANNYFVELTKGQEKVVIQATPEGNVFFLTDMK